MARVVVFPSILFFFTFVVLSPSLAFGKGSLVPIIYPCLGRLGVRAPSENLFVLSPGSSRTNAPNPFGIQGEKFPCTRSLLGESVLHRFGINRPVLSCSFLFSLKRMPVLHLVPLPSPRSDDSCLCPKASSRSFSSLGSLLPTTYSCLGRLGVRAPSENLLLLQNEAFIGKETTHHTLVRHFSSLHPYSLEHILTKSTAARGCQNFYLQTNKIPFFEYNRLVGSYIDIIFPPQCDLECQELTMAKMTRTLRKTAMSILCTFR